MNDEQHCAERSCGLRIGECSVADENFPDLVFCNAHCLEYFLHERKIETLQAEIDRLREHPTYSLTIGAARAEFDGKQMRLRVNDGPWMTIAVAPAPSSRDEGHRRE